MSSQSNLSVVENLEPAPVWKIFAQMAEVPRRSKNEDQIRAHMRNLAAEHGFGVREDAVGNMVIEVPGSPGCENAPITVIQGHLDMVCEKNNDSSHDFESDPIQFVMDERNGQRIIRANGTTLGADNGIGVAMGFAAAILPAVTHPPLELLLTIDEEAGMTGAKALEPDFFKGRRMLNLDSEEDVAVFVGCAGGCDATVNWSFQTGAVDAGAETCEVKVTGLRGGHSGCDIHLNRANAIKAVAQVLLRSAQSGLRLVDLAGGSVRNVIPREASCVVSGPKGTADALTRMATEIQEEIVRTNREKDCAIIVSGSSGADAALSTADTKTLLDALQTLPSSVLAVVPEIAGLVQTSCNLATVVLEKSGGNTQVTVGCLVRSSVRDELLATLRQIESVAKLAGAKFESSNEYPGWEPNMDSASLATCRRVYEEMFGEAAGITGIHAGLECGIINERVGGGMDMVSFGPTIECAHSPDERIYVDSVDKIWKYLVGVLAELAKD